MFSFRFCLLVNAETFRKVNNYFYALSLMFLDLVTDWLFIDLDNYVIFS